MSVSFPTNQFFPKEITLCPTNRCNLDCPHCCRGPLNRRLSLPAVLKFLDSFPQIEATRINFSGGEPFLALDFLCRVTSFAADRDSGQGVIVTNAAWFSSRRGLADALSRLSDSGYQGGFQVSLDALHGNRSDKAAVFFEEVFRVWGPRASIAFLRVKYGPDRLGDLRRYRNIPVHDIELVPVGKAASLKTPWQDDKWFIEDYCRGPGNIFFVAPGGEVRPCCGYALGQGLSLGNIYRDTPQKLIAKAFSNRFVYTVFSCGLAVIRDRLIKKGWFFPGKTSNHCLFCHYVLNTVPMRLLAQVLD